MLGDMAIQRMANVGIVFDDLRAAQLKRSTYLCSSSGWLAGEDRVQRILVHESLVGGHGPR